MDNIAEKYSKKQDSYYKLEPSTSNETSINLSSDILQVIMPNAKKGNEYAVTFSLYKEDFIKALCFIVLKLPLYTTNSRGALKIEYNNHFFEEELRYIDAFFLNDIEDYTVTLYYREDGRIYLKDLKYNNFNIRRFIVEDQMRLTFVSRVNKEIRLEIINNQYDLTSSQNHISDAPATYGKLAVVDSVLKDFVYKVVYLLDTVDSLKSMEQYVHCVSENIQLKKAESFHLTGMFIATTPGKLAARNGYGEKIRWFEKKFTLCNKTVYLSTQWYGSGHYSLMYDDFAKLVETCYGDRYKCCRSMNNEFELFDIKNE